MSATMGCIRRIFSSSDSRVERAPPAVFLLLLGLESELVKENVAQLFWRTDIELLSRRLEYPRAYLLKLSMIFLRKFR